MIVTKELLKSSNVKYIVSIQNFSEDYINKSKNITQEKLITSCFQKFYHLYNRSSNPGMASYLTSNQNSCLY